MENSFWIKIMVKSLNIQKNWFKVRTFTNANFNKVNLNEIFNEIHGWRLYQLVGGFNKNTYEDCFGIKKYDQFLEGLLLIL